MTSAHEAIADALTRSATRLFEHEPVAIAGRDPEGVHQVRVATRRLRSDLRTFHPLLDAAWARALRDELRDLATALGEVRDRDILLAHLTGGAEHLPGDVAGEALALVRIARGERTTARRRLLRVLRSARHQELRRRLRAQARAPQTTERAQEDAASTLPPLARAAWRRLDRAVDALPQRPSPVRLHDLRILAKRARYAADAASTSDDDGLRTLAKAIGALQDVLGEHHDSVVTAAWLDAHRNAAPGAAPRLARRERAAARRFAAEWRERWKAARKARPAGWR